MKILLFLLVLIFPSVGFAATTVYIGDNSTGTPVMTYSGTDDTYIQETTATTNYGSATTFYTQRYSGTDRINALIKFTGLSNITPPVTVTSATLFVNMNQHEVTTGFTLNAHRLLRDWVEAQATWNIYSTGNSWTTAGANSDGNDRSATVSASTNATGSDTQYYQFTGSQLGNDVENMINGVFSNYGWVLTFPATASFKRWYSSENADTAKRPYLQVDYTTAGGGGTVVKHRVIIQ